MRRMADSETSEVHHAGVGVCGGVCDAGVGVCGGVCDIKCVGTMGAGCVGSEVLQLQRGAARLSRVADFQGSSDLGERSHLVDLMDTSNKISNKIRKSMRGSLPPRMAVGIREAELIKIGSLKMYTLEQVPNLVECRQSEEQTENEGSGTMATRSARKKAKLLARENLVNNTKERREDSHEDRGFTSLHVQRGHSRGPGELTLADSVMADGISLLDRVKDGLPGLESENSSGGNTSVSDQWFNGKMSDEWFVKRMLLIDHEDDRHRRDWSMKTSELKKGRNRYEDLWREWVAGKEYSNLEIYPYSPACCFGMNVSSDADIEDQRGNALLYLELLKSYVSNWTRRQGRHPVALVGFSGAGLMVRGFLWMGIRCIMVDIEEQKAAPIGDDCLFVRHDVMAMDLSKMQVDLIQHE